MQVQFLSDDGAIVGTQEIERTPEELASDALALADGDVALVPVELREAAVQVKAANATRIAHCDAVIAGRAPAEITLFGENGPKTYRFYVTTPSATVIQFPKRRGPRARARRSRRTAVRSSARSGDSPDSDSEPPAAARGRWASSEGWRWHGVAR
jgi:hypothetical protein